MAVKIVPFGDDELYIDSDIPGQIGYSDLVAMAKVAKTVPKNGVVIEVGSLFGRSSFVWAKNVHPSVTVYCLDPWIREYWIIEAVEKPQNVRIPFSIEAHEYFTQDCHNIRRIQGYSPECASGWQLPIDLYYEDSDHSATALDRNFSFWEPFVKPGGVICGDEFHPDYPETLRKIEEYESLYGQKAATDGLFWWLEKPLK